MDYAATTPLHPEALKSMMPFLNDRFGNPSSTHRYGRDTRRAIEEARQRVAFLIGAAPEEIIFTSGGTEADSTAILGAARLREDKGRHIITTTIEHRAVLESCKALENHGYRITQIPVDESGIVDPQDIAAAIKPDTVLISVMHANNEIGTIQPVEEIGALAYERGILFHCDAVQSVGRIPVNVKQINCDFLSISAHKLYGPKGVGCLYIRKGIQIQPLIRGGGQERDLRGGTENVPGIVGFGKAAKLAGEKMHNNSWEMTFFRDRIIDNIIERIPGAFLNGHRFQRLPGHVNFTFTNLDGKTMISMLDEKGIAASSGSACHAAVPGPSHVLKALGYSDEMASSALRVTLGMGTTDQDVDYFLAILPDIISVLRDISPGQHGNMIDCPCEDVRPELRGHN